MQSGAADHGNLSRLDIAERSLTLPRPLVPIALLMLGQGRMLDDGERGTGFADLERAGISTGRILHPMARDILAPVASPDLVVSVEVRTAGHLEIATVWRRGPGATLGSTRDGETFEMRLIEPGMLPFHLASIAGVGLRPEPGGKPLVATLELAGLMAAGNPRAADLLSDSGFEADDVDRMVRLLGPSARRSRVSTIWCEPGGFIGDRSLELIDDEGHGYWEVTRLRETGSIVFTPRSLDAVLRLLGDAVSW